MAQDRPCHPREFVALGAGIAILQVDKADSRHVEHLLPVRKPRRLLPADVLVLADPGNSDERHRFGAEQLRSHLQASLVVGAQIVIVLAKTACGAAENSTETS